MSDSIQRRIGAAGRWMLAAAFSVAVAATAVSQNASAATPARPACDGTLASSFRPDALTRVVAVKAFKKGEPLTMDAGGSAAATAAADICLVKLVVGPGNPGPASAPSTSAGIGIEVWLPARANWTGRLHLLGGGGWQGGDAGSPAKIGDTQGAAIAAGEGAVSSQTDTGHQGNGVDASFMVTPDGAINETLWADFSLRSVHEQVAKTKALAAFYYGTPPKHSYWDGGSTGGRQGLALAQSYPDDVDGIVANYPAINLTRLATAQLYPHIVFLQDLGGKPLTMGQVDLASKAAIRACDQVGGQHLGYVLDPSVCTYDPEMDKAVLCASDGGTNAAADCLTKAQARAVNKIWYGMTQDGTAPSPAVDNGWNGVTSPNLPPAPRWYGPARGTSLGGKDGPLGRLLAVAATSPSPFGTTMVALELGDTSLADENFKNAKGGGRSQWRTLTYARLAEAFERGIAMQRQFGFANTDNPDLSAFKQRGGRMLTWHGLADELIMPQATVNYYHRVADRMGGLAEVQKFYRLYLAPGLGHGTPNGTANPDANPPRFAPEQFYRQLVDWVEKGAATEDIVLQSTAMGITKTRPVCPYPKKITYKSGDANVAASYGCS